MSHDVRTGRLRRAAVAALLAVGVTLAGPGVAGAEPGVVPPGREGLIPEGEWTQEQIDEMLALIDQTEAVLPATFPATATYTELSSTLGALGFHDFGATAPGGYVHWINNGWLDGTTLDPSQPESLVYAYEFETDTYRLVSAMFMLGWDFDDTNIPHDIAWLPGWHTHGDLCINHPAFTFAGFVSSGTPPCPSGAVPADRAPMMHVWIEDNECDHRFGGVDQSGLHCDVTHHHDPDGHDPDHDDHSDGHDPDDHDPGHDDHTAHRADPATPISAAARLTG